MEKYYITTPIYYPSADFHIGHCYTTIIADSIARYKRLLGYDVYFLTGTDEHGEKIELKAKSLGKEPQEFVDEIALEVRRIWDIMNTSYDKFVRTTAPSHVEEVSKIFKRLYEQGDGGGKPCRGAGKQRCRGKQGNPHVSRGTPAAEKEPAGEVLPAGAVRRGRGRRHRCRAEVGHFPQIAARIMGQNEGFSYQCPLNFCVKPV